MPRRPTLRSLLAALTMAVAALCGGGKALASERGTASAVEIRAGTAIRADSRKRCTDAAIPAAAAMVEMQAVVAEAGRSGLDPDPVALLTTGFTFAAMTASFALIQLDPQVSHEPRAPRSRGPPAQG